MPSYDYGCPKCGETDNRIVAIKDRDEQFCEAQAAATTEEIGPNVCMMVPGPTCGERLERVEIPSSQTNLVDKQWRVKALLADGRRIPGSFDGRVRNQKGFG